MNDGGLNLLALVSVVAFALYFGQVLWAKREFLAYHMRKAVVCLAVYVVVVSAMMQVGRPQAEVLLGAIAASLLTRLLYPSMRYSRRIPPEIRRRVIERDLRGEPFDSRRHHIDHIVPFSKGGGHTMDNLRVVERRKNLQKGARMPTFGESAGSVGRSLFRK